MNFTETEIKTINTLKVMSKGICDMTTKWLDNDETLSDYFKLNNHFVLAGGCYTSWLNNETPKDFDIFLLHSMDELSCVALNSEISRKISNNSEEVKDTSEDYLRNFKHPVKRVTTFRIRDFYKDTNFQIIQTKAKTREELIHGFDLVHACISYTPHDDKIYLSVDAFNAATNKVLRPNRGNKVEEWRINKFVSRGFKNEIVSV